MDNLFENINGLLEWLGEWTRNWIEYLNQMDVGLNIAVRVIMIAVSLTVISFLFKRMLKSQIKESAFLMWVLPAALLFIYGVWPELTYYVADLTHMAYGYALVVTVPFIGLLYYIAFKYMCQIAELTSKVVELGSVVSLQKHEISELKKQVTALQQNKASGNVSSPVSETSDVEINSADKVEVIVH